MVSTFKKSLVSMSVLFISSLTIHNANAAEESTSEKGTMGYGYQQYVKKHPEAKTKSPQLKSEAGTTANGDRVLDISEWQGQLTAQQVKELKENYDFIIIRAQYGSAKVDAALAHNSALLDQYGMKFGVYSYSMYTNPQDARNEARILYNRAPKASLYVNDFEQNNVTSGGVNESTSAWYDEMKGLAGDKKVLLYSYENFMRQNLTQTVSDYDGFWLANYNPDRPTREHVLWQYTSKYHSPELNQDVDANYTGPNVNTDWFTS